MTDDTFDLTECHRSVTFAIVSVAAAVRVDASDGAQQPKVLLLLAPRDVASRRHRFPGG